jgi:hypothetical protein
MIHEDRAYKKKQDKMKYHQFQMKNNPQGIFKSDHAPPFLTCSAGENAALFTG